MVTWVHWHTEPALLAGILAVAWAWLVLAFPLRAALGGPAGFPRRETGWFAAAVASFYLAVGSPLDAMGEGFLFSAHMVQHNLLMYLTAPLTVLALPGWLVDGLMERSRTLERVMAFLLRPLVAGFCFTFTFCVWHFPVLYETALHDKLLHMLQHLTMYLTSVQMLWPLLSRSRRLPQAAWGMQALYIFLLFVAQMPLFGILTFSPEVLYPTYELAPRLFAIEPLTDQILGGLLMKSTNIAGGLLLLGRAFYCWSRDSEGAGSAVLEQLPRQPEAQVAE